MSLLLALLFQLLITLTALLHVALTPGVDIVGVGQGGGEGFPLAVTAFTSMTR
ncbi:hypothetical protein [Streptomyces canus]|uniref:hypothetical protein n=1 Tax=Streptomyces canus TaxID=58343 RepID=UPI0027D7C653|nr:hypothetical protein [Streptomyces canus]